MADNKITPAWVVENYLLDYKNRLAEYIGECRENNVNQVLDYVLIKEFCATHFREALESFAKSICERQREICANVGVKAFENTGHREASHYAILSAPMPEITKTR